MEDDPIEQYNSDSGEGDFQMDDISNSNDDNIPDKDQVNNWIHWFCTLDGHEYIVDIDEDYIKDPFNLCGLDFEKEKLNKCLQMILSDKAPDEDELADEQFLETNQDASELYGYLHARFVNTAAGMAKIQQKFLNSLYGKCPRALCDGQKVLPCGLSDQMKVSRFKIFCPRCQEVYVPKFKSVNIDGGFFGTSFPHHFMMHHPLTIILPPKIYHYEPKIHGFMIVGKRGSKFYDPPKGNIRYNWATMTQLDKEKLINKCKEHNQRLNKFADNVPNQIIQPTSPSKAAIGPIGELGGQFVGEIQSHTQREFNSNFFVAETKTPEEVIEAAMVKSSNLEGTDEIEMINDNKKKINKKNKNKGKN